MGRQVRPITPAAMAAMFCMAVICYGVQQNAVAQASAQLKPISLSKPELKTLELAGDWLDSPNYAYREGDTLVFPFGVGAAAIVCAPERVCIIELEPGEQLISSIANAGDAVSWGIETVLGANDTTLVILKPEESGLSASLVLVTDRRTYYLNLKSDPQEFLPKVRFIYPKERLKNQVAQDKEVSQEQPLNASSAGLTIDDLNFNYTISACRKCASWAPTRVYDTGKQTIVEFTTALTKMETPVLLVMKAGKKKQVNFRMSANRYMIEGMFDEAVLVLRVGGKRQRVVIRRDTRS